MTQEEKARAYDEALKRAKSFSRHMVSNGFRYAIETIFPELKKSEDEKIRKEIIDFIDTKTIDSDERRNRWFSWLEKQSKQKSIDSYCQENCKGFQETGKCFTDGDCEAKKEAETIKLKEPDIYEYELERIVDKLNEVIGKLGDIYEVLSKPFQFPYKDYTPPQEPWYKTHGVEKVTPVICGTTTVCKPETISFNADLQKGFDYDIDKENIQKS